MIEKTMEWFWRFLISVLVQTYFKTIAIPSTYALTQGFLDGDPYGQDYYNPVDDKSLEDSIKALSSMLVQPWPPGMSPLVYIENEDSNMENSESELFPEISFPVLDNSVHDKRSKYYRKYPLKRQNRYSRYDAENRYMCLPSKDDVFRLLVALHETRQGGRGKTLHFCNRKRPAKTVFTNIRFLGK